MSSHHVTSSGVLILEVRTTGQACGAWVSGIDLSKRLNEVAITDIRRAWLKHHILVFPNQLLSDTDLERITTYFGTIGDDPYFVPIEGSHVVALTRRAKETAPVFAEVWHSDWSFKVDPPIGTCLYSLTIPPVGGETGFINQHKALKTMPVELRKRLEGKQALHSAAAGYAPDGTYGEGEKDSYRSMKILYSESAREVQAHPFIRIHPESGEETLFGTFGYICGVEGMDQDAGQRLIFDLYQWQTREEFQHTHKWQQNMLVIWDNRSILHKANGGYDGYDRELHRTTIADEPSRYLNRGQVS